MRQNKFCLFIINHFHIIFYKTNISDFLLQLMKIYEYEIRTSTNYISIKVPLIEFTNKIQKQVQCKKALYKNDKMLLKMRFIFLGE